MTSDNLLSVAYSSEASRQFTDDELHQLLKSSRAHNASAGVTGMLIYRGGRFLQVLEGPEETVKGLLGRIVKDPRHAHVRLLLSQQVGRRSFAEWTMGYEVLRANPGSIPRGFRSTFDDLRDDDSVVVQRALRELTIWFRARGQRDTSSESG